MKLPAAFVLGPGLLSLVIGSAAVQAQSQQCDAPPARAPGCAQPNYGGNPDSCSRTCQPPQGFPPPDQTPPLGFFQAPPPTGTVQGESTSSTFRGAEITFPELRLRMPSIHFPHWVKNRTNARMITEQGVAPFVEGQNLAMGWNAQPTNPLGFPPPNQGGPPNQGLPPRQGMPCDSPVPPQGYSQPPCTAPTGQSGPRCDAQALQRLEALEAERRALESRLVGLQQVLHQAASSGAAPSYSSGGLQPARPIPAQPLRQPLPPPDDGARQRQQIFEAAPAAYIPAPADVVREPRQFIVEPAAARPITEPTPPTGRITGLRAR